MAPRTPEALWRQLVDEAGDDLVEQAVAVSVEQAEKDLAAARFDVVAERAQAVARIAVLETLAQPVREIRLLTPSRPNEGRPLRSVGLGDTCAHLRESEPRNPASAAG